MMIQLRKISADARQILRPADYQPRGLHLRQAYNLGKPVAMLTPADPPGRLRQQALAGLLSSDLRGSKSEKKPGNLASFQGIPRGHGRAPGCELREVRK